MKREQDNLEFPAELKSTGPVECLGIRFDSDADRRDYFIEKLREKLQDPEFRRQPGFPTGNDEDILNLSDPPYYTACPNPFLGEFIGTYAKAYAPNEKYHREPFAIDISVGKHHPVYKAHSLHTKVPHLAIIPSILHYTRPGDVVLDGFAGSGMTGIACLWAGLPASDYQSALEAEWKKLGREAPEWGARAVVLGDLAPAATFIEANYNFPCEMQAFSATAENILREVEDELGWMYETDHRGRPEGCTNFTVWSEVFSCPECSCEIVFHDEILDPKTKETMAEFPCPECTATLSKKNLEKVFETLVDPATDKPHQRIKLIPVLVDYRVGRSRHEKRVDDAEKGLLRRVLDLPFPPEVPTDAFPLDRMYHKSALGPKGFTHVHHLFPRRSLHVLAAYLRRVATVADVRLRNALLALAQHQYVNASFMNRYRPTSSFGNSPQGGVYYVPSLIAEANVFSLIRGSIKRIERMGASGWQDMRAPDQPVCLTTGSTTSMSGMPDNSVDYIFTDPPFGANIYYADMNFMVEAWHHVATETGCEAIVDKPKDKDLPEYQELMRECFEEYCRVLKPGRWMTVVFSNSKNSVWRAIQEAIGRAGFVVADVRTLDKQMGSYRQVTSSAVKQDLVISAYKPTEALDKQFQLGSVSEDSVWIFINEHLQNVPRFVGRSGEAEIVAERTAQMLLDRMIAFHVQRRLAVPISGPDFFAGLARRYPERDSMYFLTEQVSDYDRQRTSVAELRQLSLFVTDEATAIQWVRQQLYRKPQTLQELTPQFIRETQSWAKHEETIELREILEQNFLRYESNGPVPSQIHSYLSSNFKDMRNLEKDDSALIEKADDRWYVPDPNKQSDLERLRERALLREFSEYKELKQKRLRQFRTEAVRVGFKKAYDADDYETIVTVAAKIPDKVLQEDEKLLMYYDVASMRLDGE